MGFDVCGCSGRGLGASIGRRATSTWLCPAATRSASSWMWTRMRPRCAWQDFEDMHVADAHILKILPAGVRISSKSCHALCISSKSCYGESGAGKDGAEGGGGARLIPLRESEAPREGKLVALRSKRAGQAGGLDRSRPPVSPRLTPALLRRRVRRRSGQSRGSSPPGRRTWRSCRSPCTACRRPRPRSTGRESLRRSRRRRHYRS